MESEALESSMKDAMIGASGGVVVGSWIVVAVSRTIRRSWIVVVGRFDVVANRIEFSRGWWCDGWVCSWFGSNTGGEEDGLCFLERSLGTCDLGRSWISSSGCFGFFGLSMLEGALEAAACKAQVFLLAALQCE